MTEKHIYQLRKWKLLIEDRVNSGMNVIDWCAANGYTKHTYYYWLARVRKESFPEALNNLPETITPNSVSIGAMVELPVAPTRPLDTDKQPYVPSALIRKGDLSIELYPGMDSAILKQLVETIIYA